MTDASLFNPKTRTKKWENQAAEAVTVVHEDLVDHEAVDILQPQEIHLAVDEQTVLANKN